MPSFIVLVSPSYGGAEKRFFDVFTSIRRCGEDVILVAPSSLIDQLKTDHQDRQDVFVALVSVPMDSWSRFEFVRKFRGLLQSFPLGCSYHYPLNCLWPLHLGRGDRLTMSVVDCTSVPGPFANKRTNIWDWFSFFFVTKIDVLSPAIFSAMKRYSMAGRMSLTPGGTYLVPSVSVTFTKFPTVVFIGRLVPGKGVDDFLDILPDVWMYLSEMVPLGFEFQIAGYGSLQGHVADRVQKIARSGVPITFIGYAFAEPLLARSAVLLSMQEFTNYPSRVVAEALLAGCGVIVRDTGDSREFGNDLPGLVYCQGRLDAQEMAIQLGLLLNSVMLDPGFADKVRAKALERFSSKKYIDYFRQVIFGQKV